MWRASLGIPLQKVMRILVDLIEYHWAEDIDDVLLLINRLDVRTVPLGRSTLLFE